MGFNLVVFQPAIDEWLVGTVSSSSTAGLKVSLGFFKDVTIPSSNLRAPYVFDAKKSVWAWQYHNQEIRETMNFFYQVHQLIRFRVTAVEFSEPFTAQGPLRDSAMRIVGAVDQDGLGCVAWWPDDLPFPI